MRTIAALVVGAALLLAACGQAAIPSGPISGCGDDRQDAMSIGGFPDLEAQLPRELEGKAPDIVNSGRSCSEKALGSLATHGVTELDFAGATWNQGRSDATVIAVLRTPVGQPPATLENIEEFYTAGAVAGTKTDNVTTTRPTMDPVGKVFRLEALNDLSQQTIVIWGDSQVFHVVLVATEVGPDASRADHDARVAAAVAVAGASPAGPQPTAVPASSGASSGAP